MYDQAHGGPEQTLAVSPSEQVRRLLHQTLDPRHHFQNLQQFLAASGWIDLENLVRDARIFCEHPLKCLG